MTYISNKEKEAAVGPGGEGWHRHWGNAGGMRACVITNMRYEIMYSHMHDHVWTMITSSYMGSYDIWSRVWPYISTSMGIKMSIVWSWNVRVCVYHLFSSPVSWGFGDNWAIWNGNTRGDLYVSKWWRCDQILHWHFIGINSKAFEMVNFLHV